MTQRVLAGEVIDSRKIGKHLADVVQLSALLTPGVLIEAPLKVRKDLQRFASLVANLDSSKYAVALDRISAAFGLVR